MRNKQVPPRRRQLFGQLLLFNIIVLTVLIIGIFIVSELRSALVNAYRTSLFTQARIMASALADRAGIVEIEQTPVTSLADISSKNIITNWDYENVRSMIRSMVGASKTRVRLYSHHGQLLVDSQFMQYSGTIITRELPALPSETPPKMLQYLSIIATEFRSILANLYLSPHLIRTNRRSKAAKSMSEVDAALHGEATSQIRTDSEGREIITVAVPVQSYRLIIGTLLLSSNPGEIEAVIRAERIDLLYLFAIALAMNFGLSFFVTRLWTRPISHLARAARKFIRNSAQLPAPETIPDLSERDDEIGDLSLALRAMTERLVSRINTIDDFVADVAHELKNPLTSLHSAIQTLDNTNDPKSRAHLYNIITHDVDRLNRLITDISSATRLDIDLDLDAPEQFDLSQLAIEMGEILNTTLAQENGVTLKVNARTPCPIEAQKLRIAQIIDNLVRNAVSFTPHGGEVQMRVQSTAHEARLSVIDNGPGLAPGTEEKIFRRFYTDRQNLPRRDAENNVNIGHSGLGLSISRQIARAHDGNIIAQNRPRASTASREQGAIFTLTLPRNPTHR